jgi:hypothetical protein
MGIFYVSVEGKKCILRLTRRERKIRIRGYGEFVHAGTFDFISSCLYNMKIHP